MNKVTNSGHRYSLNDQMIHFELKIDLKLWRQIICIFSQTFFLTSLDAKLDELTCSHIIITSNANLSFAFRISIRFPPPHSTLASISPTFYARIFCTKLSSKPNSKQRKDFRMKNVQLLCSISMQVSMKQIVTLTKCFCHEID